MKKYVFKIICQLLKEADFITSSELAEKVNINPRSLRLLFDEADDYLTAHQQSKLERIPNRGIRIREKEKHRVEGILIMDYHAYDILDFSILEDRQLFLLFLLLSSHEKLNIEPLASKMDVSVRTISNDMNQLRHTLEELGAQLVFDKRNGYSLQGGLFVVRNKLLHDLKKEFEIHSVMDLMFVFSGLYRLNHEVFILQDNQCVLKLKELLDDILPGSYSGEFKLVIVFYLLLLVLSADTLHDSDFNEQELTSLRQSYHYELAKILRLKTNELLLAQLTSEEDYFLTILLRSMPCNPIGNDEQNYPFEMEVLAQKIIQLVSDEQQFDFKADGELFYIIVNHLIPMVYRLMFNCQITNPLIKEIQSKYGELHRCVCKAMEIVTQFCNRSVSNDESSFFTLYFASSIEKLTDVRQKKLRVLIVCNSGNAVSRLLQYKLINMFNINVADVTSERNLYDRLLMKDIDLIVSVVEVDEKRCLGIPCVRISALMQKADYERLEVYLHKRLSVSKNGQSLQKNGLLDLLVKQNFAICEQVNSFDELIVESGRLLEVNGYCDEEYTRQMVTVAHRFGALTHIMIAPGIILAHAGISEHVSKVGFSFVRLKQAIMVNGKPVMGAFALCTTEKQLHQTAIQELALLFNQPRFLNEVCNVESYEAFAQLVNECLKHGRRN